MHPSTPEDAATGENSLPKAVSTPSQLAAGFVAAAAAAAASAGVASSAPASVSASAAAFLKYALRTAMCRR